MKKEMDVVKQLENKKYHKNYAPIIIVSIFLVFILGIASAWTMMHHFAPAKLGGVAYRFNWYTYALKLYEKDYKDNEDINSLYMALNISIKLNKDEKVINLYETFEDSDGYGKYIEFVDAQNLKQDMKPMIKSTLIDEDNYLKNQYIQSLIDLKQDEKAFQYALNNDVFEQPEYNNIGNYLFNNFCKKGSIDKFYDNFRTMNESGNMLLMDIYYYMEHVNGEFLKSFTNQTEEVYLWSMGNRVLQVGANVLALCEKLNIENCDGVDVVVNTQNTINNINQKFKLLTSE